MGDRYYQSQHERTCAHCSKPFVAWNRAGRYCTERCRTDAATARRNRSAAGAWLQTPVLCGICAIPFMRTKRTGPNKRYCSPECSVKARIRDTGRYAANFPMAMAAYNRQRAKKHGVDTLLNRLRRRYPDLPTVCEAANCSETRVLEIAHRPQFKRNGAWRSVARCERHMFWILCPTCHRVLDNSIESPEQMGLP